MRKWLEVLRKKAGLTQGETAELSNIARTTYAMIEQGRREPSVKVAKDIARTLKFDWTTFFNHNVHDSCINDEVSNNVVG